ncbi:unnamed protein product [Polarella glacialis]|uniref:Uncharacterized protein n=1 Tax=Polarella glacialis TaxID=89957 RepID=A0A813M623_POLGL|nr:unnamed protein product [Polarella glacialis]
MSMYRNSVLGKQAEAALDVLDKKEFNELKALTRPPPDVVTVCETALHLQAGLDPAIEIDKRGKAKDRSWKGIQKMLNDPSKFLANLKGFKDQIDSGNVPAQNVEEARRLKDGMGDDFSPEVMKKKSQAAGGLSEWVINIIKYYDVISQIEPKKKSLQDATDTLEKANERHIEVTALVKDLEEKLEHLVSEFDQAIEEKESVMAEAERCQAKLNMAQRLVGALSANGVIWEQTVETTGEELRFIPGDSLVACSFASYLGVFTREYREQATELFVKFLEEHNVQLGPKPDPLAVLSTEAEQARWCAKGLPSDRVSLENGRSKSSRHASTLAKVCVIIAAGALDAGHSTDCFPCDFDDRQEQASAALLETIKGLLPQEAPAPVKVRVAKRLPRPPPRPSSSAPTDAPDAKRQRTDITGESSAAPSQLPAVPQEPSKVASGMEVGGAYWLERCSHALEADRLQSEERTRAKRLPAAGEGQELQLDGQPVPLYWRIDLPDISKVLSQRGVLPSSFLPVVRPHATLLYLGGDPSEERVAQKAGLSLANFRAAKLKLQKLQGKLIVVRMTEIIIEENVACAIISLPEGVPCTSKVPHVTLATKHGVPARHANDVLEEVVAGRKEGVTRIRLPKPKELRGILGLETSASSAA